MKLAKGSIVCFIALWLALNAPCDGALAAAKTWYVDASVSQSGDRTSSQRAFKTIQEGINAAAASRKPWTWGPTNTAPSHSKSWR